MQVVIIFIDLPEQITYLEMAFVVAREVLFTA